jgi:hypothetical protein
VSDGRAILVFRLNFTSLVPDGWGGIVQNFGTPKLAFK